MVSCWTRGSKADKPERRRSDISDRKELDSMPKRAQRQDRQAKRSDIICRQRGLARQAIHGASQKRPAPFARQLIKPRCENAGAISILAVMLALVIVRDTFSRESGEHSRDELNYNADRLIDLARQGQVPDLRQPRICQPEGRQHARHDRRYAFCIYTIHDPILAQLWL